MILKFIVFMGLVGFAAIFEHFRFNLTSTYIVCFATMYWFDALPIPQSEVK